MHLTDLTLEFFYTRLNSITLEEFCLYYFSVYIAIGIISHILHTEIKLAEKARGYLIDSIVLAHAMVISFRMSTDSGAYNLQTEALIGLAILFVALWVLRKLGIWILGTIVMIQAAEGRLSWKFIRAWILKRHEYIEFESIKAHSRNLANRNQDAQRIFLRLAIEMYAMLMVFYYFVSDDISLVLICLPIAIYYGRIKIPASIKIIDSYSLQGPLAPIRQQSRRG